jgi:hypothetical protein
MRIPRPSYWMPRESRSLPSSHSRAARCIQGRPWCSPALVPEAERWRLVPEPDRWRLGNTCWALLVATVGPTLSHGLAAFANLGGTDGVAHNAAWVYLSHGNQDITLEGADRVVVAAVPAIQRIGPPDAMSAWTFGFSRPSRAPNGRRCTLLCLVSRRSTRTRLWWCLRQGEVSLFKQYQLGFPDLCAFQPPSPESRSVSLRSSCAPHSFSIHIQ